MITTIAISMQHLETFSTEKARALVMLVSYVDPSSATGFKQLFGESEGKDDKGIFPSAATFSTDLLKFPLGQFIQARLKLMFETVMHTYYRQRATCSWSLTRIILTDLTSSQIRICQL